MQTIGDPLQETFDAHIDRGQRNQGDYKPMRARSILIFVFIVLALVQLAAAQSTEFKYQGRLTSTGAPASGGHDFEFALFDSLAAGSQLGATINRNGVSVTDGIFAVNLDFGNQFPGGPRFLEIRVRPSGGGAFTTLNPRQEITSTPYAVRSQAANSATNADQLGGVPASSYLQTNGNGSGLTNLDASSITTGTLAAARGGTGPAGAAGNFLRSNGSAWTSSSIQPTDLPAGASSYIQNTSSPQASSNFNVSGNGTIGGVLSAGRVSVGGVPNGLLVPSGFASFFGGGGGNSTASGSGNTAFGTLAGAGLTSGQTNSVFGTFAGESLNAGSNNSFFGFEAGTGAGASSNNSFFGSGAGRATNAGSNSFFGADAGRSNNTGTSNSFFGHGAGKANTIGTHNSIFGFEAGFAGPDGFSNSFFGAEAGRSNGDGEGNSFFGRSAGKANISGNGNAYFGSNAGLITLGSNNTLIGGSAGSATGTSNTSTFVGGLTGETLTSAADVTLLGFRANGTGARANATAVGARASVGIDNSIVLGSIVGVNGAASNVRVGIGTNAPAANLHVMDGGATSGRIQVGATSASTQDKIITFGDAFCATCVSIGERGADDRMELQAGTFMFRTGHLLPGLDGSQNIGGPSNRWATVYAANGAINTSDAKLKSGIGSLNYGLKDLMKLRPVSFAWKNKLDNRIHLGLLAQETEKVIPEAVYRDADPTAPLGMNYSELVPVVIKAVQEQQAVIAEQRTLIEKQTKAIELLELRLKKLERGKRSRK
jgi:hypothetical protein